MTHNDELQVSHLQSLFRKIFRPKYSAETVSADSGLEDMQSLSASRYTLVSQFRRQNTVCLISLPTRRLLHQFRQSPVPFQVVRGLLFWSVNCSLKPVTIQAAADPSLPPVVPLSWRKVSSRVGRN